MSELTITEEQVRKEHLEEVNPARHWLLLAVVVVGAFLLMVALIAALGAAGA